MLKIVLSFVFLVSTILFHHSAAVATEATGNDLSVEIAGLNQSINRLQTKIDILMQQQQYHATADARLNLLEAEIEGIRALLCSDHPALLRHIPETQRPSVPGMRLAPASW